MDNHTRFIDGVDDQALRSPSRLGYSDDIPVIIKGSWENTSQDSNREDYQYLDLQGITEEVDNKQQPQEGVDVETKDNAQQTDFPITPSTPNTPLELRDSSRKQFVTSHSFINKNQQGVSPKHPFEKTVFFVKSVQSPKSAYESKTANVTIRPSSATGVPKLNNTNSTSSRVDSGYGSRQETIRIHNQPYSAKSDKTVCSSVDTVKSPATNHSTHSVCWSDRPGSGRCVQNKQISKKSETMSHYNMEIYSSPLSSARLQEKEELQVLNERFSNYIQKVRMLNEQNSRLDAGSFIKQTRILEEEVANLKTLYERELDVLRQEVNALSRERNNYQLQCEKNRQAAIDFESRMAVETDKNRRLMDDLNKAQQKAATMETELMKMCQAGEGHLDFQGLQREMDKIIRENEDHKHRQEQEALLRAEAEDKCHTLTKKLEFNEQVHNQQVIELRERLEQSQATILSLESRLRDATQSDIAVPEVLKHVREQAEFQLKQYQMESEETYNRNISALKCQMDNDAHNIERLSSEKSQLQGQIGELHAKIRNLEGQILTLEHQRSTVEELIQHERSRSATQIQEMERKLRDMQELVFIKMREASTARDLHIPLKAEIEGMRVLLEEEEKRLQLRETTQLQTPLAASSQTQLTSSATTTAAAASLPAVTMATTSLGQPLYPPASPTQHVSVLESPFVTQSAAHNQFVETVTDTTGPMLTNVQMPSAADSGVDFVGATKYTYETTPSVNRLHIESSPRNSPRAVGPISRAKSAPAQRAGQNVPLVPTSLGQGKDYFDEMFKDLTRETLYTQTRPKSSPTERPPSSQRERPPSASRERPPSAPRERPPSATRERPPSAARERPPSAGWERPPSRAEAQALSDEQKLTLEQDGAEFQTHREKRSPERPPSSVFHDYTTSTSSAVGEVKILEVNQEGKFVRLMNDGKSELEFGGYMIQQNVGGHPVAVFRFPPRTKFPEESTITIWSGSADPIEHQPPKNFVWREQQKWGTGPECTTILCKPNGQAIAWMTAAHRFTKNPYDEAAGERTDEYQVYETGAPANTHDEVLTEMNVNLNEPKPEPVYLRREKQTRPSLTAQKHPHGTYTGRETHPCVNQARPLTYGNDNSSVNRQSRVQSTRPDPIPGQPYAGGSGNRMGSAPLRKYTNVSSGNIRGSGAIANRSAGTIRHGPPTPFLSPKQQEYSEFCDNRPLVRFST